MADRAYHLIKQRILGNEFPPGYQALEQELAVHLGMSRTPIREALVRLEQEGLCEVLPRRGMRVRPLSAQDMRELYDILCCIEAKAVQLIARRHPGPAELQPLEDEVACMDRALEANDLEAWAEADGRFHVRLLELCGNRRLAEIGLSALEQAHRVRMFTLRLRRKPFRSTEDHHRLVDALRRGDADGAMRLNWEHRECAAAELLAILERYQVRSL